MKIKSLLKCLFIFFHIDITKNIEYDRLTKQILKKNLKKNSNCLDIGCHKGEILDLMLKTPRQENISGLSHYRIYSRFLKINLTVKPTFTLTLYQTQTENLSFSMLRTHQRTVA